ncbi:uncharacterized protein JCM6883_005794 [Sporobolomyces salmoneus]|uniref:uncharacterized protein n=1 Tax=Sporobolomyces salmoneus TaxID=183962 RepID=UPI00317B52CA
MSISFECLDKYLDALHGRISNKDPKVHAEVLAVRQYFHLHWNDDRISNSLRQAILEKIKRVLELPERYLDVEEVPSLYDLTGLNDSEVKPEVWPVKVPRTFLDQALQSLVRRIEKTAACVESEEEVQRSEFYRDWATYPSWAQVECVGYTLSRIQRVWDVKDALWRDGVKRINRGSESARRIGNACPKLEVYVKIVQNQDPISFHQALLKLSSLSSPSNEDVRTPFTS